MAPRSFLRFSLLISTLLFVPFTYSQTSQKPCPPGISFCKLFDAVGIGYADGRLELGTLYAICLPTPSATSTSNYPYDPDGGGKLSAIL